MGRVAMYRDISDALRHERSLLHEESQESKESLDMDASIDQVIQGLGSDAFDGSKYDLDCNDGQPTSGELEYDVEDASLSSPKIIEMVRHELGPAGLAKEPRLVGRDRVLVAREGAHGGEVSARDIECGVWCVATKGCGLKCPGWWECSL